MSHYQRIACLSTEAVETLYALGAEDVIAGISGFTVRPPRAREEKPGSAAFRPRTWNASWQWNRIS